MAQSKHEIQSILSQAGMQPRHRFGQNFMIDQNLVKLVADAGEVAAGDCVIEVGPGTGTLTDELLARGAEVLAVEIDRDLAQALAHRFETSDRFELIIGDALAGKHKLNGDLVAAIADPSAESRRMKLVANLPYNIASPLVIELLLAGVDLLAFVVQKEVGDRLAAKEGTDDYGPLTVMAQLLSDVEILRKLPPAAFWPAPRIDSALVRMRRRDQLGSSAGPFHEFLRKIFSARRKTLRKALVGAGVDADAALARSNLDGQIRAEELSPARLLELFNKSRENQR